MVIEIKMCRFDNVPWGFRLVGGSDFEFPLTVVKVTEGSIAEEAGLRADDIIVRINDTATSPLSHDEVNQIIRHCGNVFYLGVYREGVEEPVHEQEQEQHQQPQQDQLQLPACQHFPITGIANRCHTPDSFLDVSSSCKSPISRTYSEDREYLPELPDRPCSALSESMEIKLVEDEIAAVLSGESEVLKQHNVMGIFPKPGVCMSSDVLRTLNEEAIKTKAEKDKENRKWTTFLQKPNRPIPKSKAQLDAEKHAQNAYKVKIVKSTPRPPETPASPINEPKSENLNDILKVNQTEKQNDADNEPDEQPEKHENSNETEIEKAEVASEPETPPPTDTEVPNLEEISIQDTTSTETPTPRPATEAAEINDEGKNEEDSSKEHANRNDNEVEGTSTVVHETPIEEGCIPETPTVQKTEEELALESQLADVQRQLVALSSLPSTIQSTLDAVTKQLADLLPAFKLQQVTPLSGNSNETRSLQLEQIDESNAEGTQTAEKSSYEQQIHAENDNTEVEESSSIDLNNNGDDTLNAVDKEVEALNTINREMHQQQQQQPQKQQTQQFTEEQNIKKEKKQQIIEELEEHLQRKTNPKRSKRAFGPLTPSSERPVVLPGGRRWYRPKDAYNDEFIAEVLSSQAELITGTTLGSSYESPYLGYDTSEFHSRCATKQIEMQRVNFMKYQKPEKKIDLNRSEVYKVIHHLDRQPVRGIEIRAPVVPAEADIRKAVQS